MNFPGTFPPNGGELEYLLIGTILGTILSDWLVLEQKSRNSLLRLILGLLLLFAIVSFIFWK